MNADVSITEEIVPAITNFSFMGSFVLKIGIIAAVLAVSLIVIIAVNMRKNK